ncbi:MAG: NAD(P)H-dependent oxidoreductase [Rhodobacteraceae bacterium]|nr:NAD(P)H-dependent oxidoreductase [Paracoccaceae bacterium]
MSNLRILNGHQPSAFSKGNLNHALVARSRDQLTQADATVRSTTIADGYDIETEIANHLWAYTVILQFPVNWMGLPWSFKKYMDEVYTAGMGDTLDLRYMLSGTFNAPKYAFDDPAQAFFKGGSVDDVLRPIHLTMAFMNATPLHTFAAFDVMKNPTITGDFTRFDAHIAHHLIQDQIHIAG